MKLTILNNMTVEERASTHPLRTGLISGSRNGDTVRTEAELVTKTGTYQLREQKDTRSDLCV